MSDRFQPVCRRRASCERDFAVDVDEAERLLGRDLSTWKHVVP